LLQQDSASESNSGDSTSSDETAMSHTDGPDEAVEKSTPTS